MRRKRFQEIAQLYHAAMELPEGERAGFLESCKDDDIRREVLSLLQNEDKAASFLEDPALEVASRLTSEKQTSLLGRKLDSYHIISELGKGGMGEVYKAKDKKLGRDVAIKILPEEFAEDADRVARFQREAKLLASLNHPNIASIYGLEESEETRFLILEFVEGDTLADLIKKGPIPVEESLKFALQIAEALEAAHEKGVIHRDLKPANIKVTPDGKVMVLDFGLAKAYAGDLAEVNLSHSPTLSAAATQRGVILGTAAYMSPEQAKGKSVDRGTDIWAFGCVLYEMLTGQAAFQGEDITEILARVIEREPNWTMLPLKLPTRIQELLRRCLQKNLKKRWRDAGDLCIELELAGEIPVGTVSPDDAPALPSARRKRALWFSAILIAVIMTWFTSVLLNRNSTQNEPTAIGDLVRFSISPPEGTAIYSGGWTMPFAISPDGRWIAFTATSSDTRSRLWIRRLGSEVAQPIPATEGAVSPFWSPDSEWLGFQVQNAFYRVRIPGGIPEAVCTFKGFTSGIGNATWGDDVILYSGSNGAIFRASIQGGQPEPLTVLDSSLKERIHWWPQFLSDGRHFLYVVFGDPTRIYVDSIDGGQKALVMEMPDGGSIIRFAPGYIFYVEDTVLWAHPFDESNHRLIGNRERVIEGLPLAGPGAAPFAISHNGILAYWTQSLIQQASQLQWLDRKGNRLKVVDSPAVYDGFDLSRDGSKVVSARVGKDGIALWINDLVAGGSFPVRFSMSGTVPVWAPNGTQFAFLGSGALHLADADQVANNPIRITDPSMNQLAQSWTAAGDQLVYENWDPENGIDLVVLRMEDKNVKRLDWNTVFNEFGGRLSPNDNWIAYVTDQTGRNEVWVAGFPSGIPRRQISPSGGSHPCWRDDGSELYFISTEGQLVAVPFNSHGSTIDTGTPTNLFRIRGNIDVMAGSHNVYKTNDGQRFLVAVKSEDVNVPPIRLILNWHKLLTEK